MVASAGSERVFSLATRPRTATERGVDRAPRRPGRTRAPRWLRAVTALLAAIFALPSCFTFMVWQDDRSRTTEGKCEKTVPMVLPADGERPMRLAVKASPGTLAAVHSVIPEVPTAAPWLVIEVVDHPESLAWMVSHGASLRDGGLQLVEPVDGTPPRIELEYWQPDSWPNMPGTVKYRSPVGIGRRLRLACRVSSAASLPDGAVPATFETFEITRERVSDDGTPIVRRVLLTPLALAGDVLLLPFELLALPWWW